MSAPALRARRAEHEGREDRCRARGLRVAEAEERPREVHGQGNTFAVATSVPLAVADLADGAHLASGEGKQAVVREREVLDAGEHRKQEREGEEAARPRRARRRGY